VTAALEVAGSLWSAPDTALEEARRLASAGLTRLHWDLADGIFTVAGGFAPETAQSVSAQAGVDAEAHLMVAEPLSWLDPWTEFCDVVAVHAESNRWVDAVRRIDARAARPAVAISPQTGLDVLDALHGMADDYDVLLMSIQPGHAGSTFDPAVVDRVRQLRGKRVGVDGSVTVDRARDLAAAGASWVVSGTDLLGSPDPGGWLTRAGAEPLTKSF